MGGGGRGRSGGPELHEIMQNGQLIYPQVRRTQLCPEVAQGGDEMRQVGLIHTRCHSTIKAEVKVLI